MLVAHCGAQGSEAGAPCLQGRVCSHCLESRCPTCIWRGEHVAGSAVMDVGRLNLERWESVKECSRSLLGSRECWEARHDRCDWQSTPYRLSPLQVWISNTSPFTNFHRLYLCTCANVMSRILHTLWGTSPSQQLLVHLPPVLHWSRKGPGDALRRPSPPARPVPERCCSARVCAFEPTVFHVLGFRPVLKLSKQADV